MSRHFADWLTAYEEYARDSFCPEKFHRWTGISVLAGALERKVWTHKDKILMYPNLYVMLIARPGVGKTTAGDIGVFKFLKRLRGPSEAKINFLATQSSEASFYLQMASSKKFFVKDKEHKQSSGYLYASEGSNTLKEMVGGGSIVPALTEFYDCSPHWTKILMKSQYEVFNACFNMLACCTFAHLTDLIPAKQAAGGFASRILYVVQDELFIRNPKWEPKRTDPQLEEKLFADLTEIHHLTGHFLPDAEFISAWEKWFPIQDLATQSLKSERMQHFLARKHTNLLKLSMIVSVSESDSLRLSLSHWNRALELMKEVEVNLPTVLDHTVNKEKQGGISYLILKSLKEGGNQLMRNDLMASLIQKGIPLNQFETTLNMMISAGLVRKEISGAGQFRYTLLTDPENYL